MAIENIYIYIDERANYILKAFMSAFNVNLSWNLNNKKKICKCIEITFSSQLIYTVGTESIQTPLNFSLFVILQPFC